MNNVELCIYSPNKFVHVFIQGHVWAKIASGIENFALG